MINIINKVDCSGCSACVQSCPHQCISMQTDEEGFLYPIVDSDNCVGCNKCEKVCPVLTKRYNDITDFPVAYLCYEKEKNSRVNSAAGGAFYAIAKGFIEKRQGVVFGAAYDSKFDVKHISVDNIDDLNKLQKSKYVQSEIGRVYTQVIEWLKKGRCVLFSGTTCQVAGLKRLVPEKLQERLYCIDLSCYGVPSPAVFKEYLHYQEDKNGPIQSVIIRDKKLYKTMFRVGYGIVFKDGKKYFQPHGVDPMARIFYSHIGLRPICYECPFKTVSRISDITLGDCWYADEFIPGFQDKYGVTMMLMHSEKAKELLNAADSLVKYPVDAEKVIKVNGGMIFKSSQKPYNREEFFQKFNTHSISFDSLADMYAPAHYDSMKYKLVLVLKEIGILPSFIQKNKRKIEVKKRCKEVIPVCALKKYW